MNARESYGMTEKIIENWLTKSSEKSYQFPFCFLLTQEGKTVIHLTRHTSMEHGKDVLAVDREGCAHVYQLKGISGNRLTVSEWKSMYEQILQMVFTPCTHPSIRSDTYHKSYLVVNGGIDEEVQHAIIAFNNEWINRGQPQYCINTIVGGEILSMAYSVKHQFIPNELKDFKNLLECYLESGTGFLNKEKLFRLLITVMEEKVYVSKAEARRLVSSNALLCSLATKPYTDAENHFAIIEAWTLFISNVLRFIERNNYTINEFRDELDIAWQIIQQALIDLYRESSYLTDFVIGYPAHDLFVYRHRTTIVLGLLAYLGTINKDNDISFEMLEAIIDKHIADTDVWGETAIPFFLSIYLFYKKGLKYEKADQVAISLINTIFAKISRADILFADIYTSAEQSVEYMFSAPDGDSASPWISHVIEPLLSLICKPQHRAFVERSWPNISQCIFAEFIIEDKVDTYLWRVTNGQEVTTHPAATQSWSKLLTAMNTFSIDSIPRNLVEFKTIVPLFLMVFPQRINTNIVKWLNLA